MQIKKLPHTIRMAIIFKIYKLWMLERVLRKRNSPSLLVGCKFVQPLWIRECRFLKKLTRATIRACNPIPGKAKSSNSKRYTHSSVNSGTAYNSQDMKATYKSMDRWMGKEDNGVCVYIYVYMCHVRLLATIWTKACQDPLSMGFSR